MLQVIDLEIRYFAGILFVDTAKYHGRLLPSSFNCFDVSNDSNFLNSLLRVEKKYVIVTLTNYLVFPIFNWVAKYLPSWFSMNKLTETILNIS